MLFHYSRLLLGLKHNDELSANEIQTFRVFQRKLLTCCQKITKTSNFNKQAWVWLSLNIMIVQKKCCTFLVGSTREVTTIKRSCDSIQIMWPRHVTGDITTYYNFVRRNCPDNLYICRRHDFTVNNVRFHIENIPQGNGA